MRAVVGSLASRCSGIGRTVVDIVYPPRCAGCGHRGSWVCNKCLPTVQRFTSPWCPRCGVPEPYACACDRLDPALDMARSAGWHDGWLRGAVTAFKYEGEHARKTHLSALMVPLLGDMWPSATLVPIPLHPTRERQRGYNQAVYLARAMESSCGLEVNDLLERTVQTRPQVGLSAEERSANIKGAFSALVDRDLTGRGVILVDDVMTTGATAGECAIVLKRAGAAWVGAITIARER